MRIKKHAPLPAAGLPVEEIDLSEEAPVRKALGVEKPGAAEPGAVKEFSGAIAPHPFADFDFTAEISLKGVHIPILTPLAGEDVPGSPAEPVFDSAAQDDIQGNIIPGFNKDHQHFLFFRIGKVPLAKRFLREVLPRISTMEEVVAFRR